MKNKINTCYKVFFILFILIVAGLCHSCSRAKETVDLQVLEQSKSQAESESQERKDDAEAVSTVIPKYYVHICGEVLRPGVYEMEIGERVYQVIEQAGGYTEAAATDFLNLAEMISDGMKLVVPDKETLLNEQGSKLYGAVDPSAGTVLQGAKINLNTASKEQLMTLRGIGEARAMDIIHFRETQGEFQTIEEIKKVSGIKDAAFQKIKDDITV